MKKVISLILALAMLLPCLSACTKEKDAEKSRKDDKENTSSTDDTEPDGSPNGTMPGEDLGVTEEFSQMLGNAVILLLDSLSCCAKGAFLINEGGAAPVMVGEDIYIPAGLVAQLFGGTVSRSDDGTTMDIQVFGKKIQIVANALVMSVDGTEVQLQGTASIEKDDIMIPANAFCQAVNKSVHCHGNMVVIGDDLAEASADVPEETVNLTLDAVQATLESMTNGMDSVSAADDLDAALKLTREDWGSFSMRFDIDPSLTPWHSAKDKLLAVTGNMFIEDTHITAGINGTYECSMKVYNYLNYTYGAVEVYDANDQLYHVYRIKPFEGQKASVSGYFHDLVVMATDITQAIAKRDWEELGYRSALNSNIQNVEFTVPAGGYAIITNNPKLSDNVAAYNMIHAVVEITAAAGDLVSLASDADGVYAIKKAMEDALMDELMQDATMVPVMASEFMAFLNQCSQLDSFDIGGYATTAVTYFWDMINRMDIDFGPLIAAGLAGVDTALQDVAEKFTDKIFDKANPAKIAMIAWDISTNFSNMVCLFVDMNNATRARPLMLQTCNWKAAYAEILRGYDNVNSYTFTTAYLDNNMIPELFVMQPAGRMSMVHIYSYQNDKVVQLQDPLNGENIYTPYGTFGYYELLGCLGRSSMSMGVSSLQYLEMVGDTFVIQHNFIDDALAEPAKVTYTYNGNEVSKFWYDYKIQKVKNSYDERHILVDCYACQELNESNIVAEFES